MSRYKTPQCCPWNQRFPDRLAAQDPGSGTGADYRAVSWAAHRDGEPPLPALDGPDLVGLPGRILALSGKEYRRVFAESPLSRPGRKGMLRNLCVALGNYGVTSPEPAARARPVLERAAQDPSELVREHAEWGLEAMG